METGIAIGASALAMTAIVALRYLLTSGGFALATAKVHPGLYARLGPQMRKEIAWSLASAAIYGVPAGIVAWGWQAHGWAMIYRGWNDYPLWYLPIAPCCTCWRTTRGSTGPIAGCIGPHPSASPTWCITPAARPRPGRR